MRVLPSRIPIDRGDFFEISLPHGRSMFIDKADYHLIEGRTVSMSGPHRSRPYAFVLDGERKIVVHQAIVDAAPGMVSDHANGNTLDNRRSNLRAATHAQNCVNRRWDPRNTSGFRGVSKCKKGPSWRAGIGKTYIGAYPTPESAARAYDKKAREIHGAFARVNFPEEGERAAKQVGFLPAGSIANPRKRGCRRVLYLGGIA